MRITIACSLILGWLAAGVSLPTAATAEELKTDVHGIVVPETLDAADLGSRTW